MECGLGGESRIIEKFKLTPTCLGIKPVLSKVGEAFQALSWLDADNLEVI